MSDAAPLSYHQWQPSVRPPWHAGQWGERWAQALGLLKDGLAQGAEEAVRVRSLSRCSDDALAYHGQAFGFPQAPGEPASVYRARLRRAWHYHAWRGTRKGIVDLFTDILTPLLTPAQLAAIPADWIEVHEAFTAGWGRHSGVAGRRRWINIVLRQPHPFGTDGSFRLGDGTKLGPLPGGSGKRLGLNGDAELAVLLQRMAFAMKPAHTHCEWIAVVLAGDIKHAGLASDGEPFDASSRVAYLPVTGSV